jgi:beta-galactosidase
VLSHDLEPNRVYLEVSRTAQELKQIGPKLVNLKKNNKVALLYSVDSYQGIRFMPFHDKVDYLSILHQLYRALFRLNIGVDFVFPQSRNFADYRVIVVPPLYIASDDLLARLNAYVEGGGHLLLTMKSGFCNEYSTVRWERMPGPLRKICGFSYQEFSSLKGDLPLKGDPYQVGEGNKVSVWAEMLMPETATPAAFYDHPFFGKYPAITRNKIGQGTVTYEGTVLSDQLQERVLTEVLQPAGLTGPDQKLPAPVRVQHGVGNSGKSIHYYLNYSGQPQSFSYPYAGGTDLLTRKAVEKAQNLTLAPWDLAIVEEH